MKAPQSNHRLIIEMLLLYEERRLKNSEKIALDQSRDTSKSVRT
jgi:hypothetical protein